MDYIKGVNRFLKKVVVLGSGTSTGVPLIGCQCSVCKSENLRNKRMRASLFLEFQNGKTAVIDTGPDFRMQALSLDLCKLDAVIYTHTHADHCHGFDDLRAFSVHQPYPIEAYGSKTDLTEIKERFAYAFGQSQYGGLLPIVNLNSIPEEGFFDLFGYSVEVIRLEHGNTTTAAFRFDDFGYATDFKDFTADHVKRWKNKIRTMVASGIYYGEHKSHSVIPETLQLFDDLGVKMGWITHLGHSVDYDLVTKKLPKNRWLCYDGLAITH